MPASSWSDGRPSGSLLALSGVLALLGCSEAPPAKPGADRGPAPFEAGRDRSSDRGSRDQGQATDHLAGPPYPIVLAHGFFGFNQIASVDYFYHVEPALTAAGHRVFVTTVDPFNSVSVRGEQLLKQVTDILQQTGSAKLNIIGHSQGGLDARYVASRIPERISAVVGFAVPNLGTKVADAVLDQAPGFTVGLLQSVCALAGRPFWGDIAKDPDFRASLESISTSGAAAFNVAYPDVEGVRYYSVSGRTNMQLGEKACEAPKAPPFITRYNGTRDPLDPTLVLTAALLSGSILDPAPNDGMVSVSSAKWGTWLGCIPADHMDEMGQYLGDPPGVGNSFDHIEFYKDLATFLVSEGF